MSMNIKTFEKKLQEFKSALVEALVKIDPAPEVSISPYRGISNVWHVNIYADLEEDNYLIWVDGITGEPVWWRVTPFAQRT
jgi:hypothetical protein